MSVDPQGILVLPTAEKLRLVELLWDDLANSGETLPLPSWIGDEAVRRREELRQNPDLGLSHREVWKQPW